MKSPPFIAAALTFWLGMSSLSAAEATVKSFSPSSDKAQSLGTASNRWDTVFSKKINDGEGNEIDVGEAAAAIGVAQARDHAALTVESRAAADAHPIAAISGLAAILQPAAAGSDGLMSADDKSKLDDIDNARLVYKNQNNDIRLEARATLLGAGIDGGERQLIRLSPDNRVQVGDNQVPLTVRASERPSVAAGSQSGQAGEKIAYLSDLAPYATVERLAGGLANKADLVDGAVPLPQLPPQAVSQLWEVDAPSGLTGLAQATAGDFARIGGGSEQGHVYTLTASDPSRLENWIDITAEDVVLSVNGKNGIVSLGLADLPDVAASLAGKAPLASPALTGTPTAPTQNVGDNTDKIATTAFVKKQGYVTSGDLGVDLTSYAKLNSPALTGTPTAPTAAAGTNTTQLATTAFVNAKAAGYLPLAGGTLSGNLALPSSSNISFGSAVGGKLNLYATSYQLGIESGTLFYRTGGIHKFYRDSTEQFRIDNNDIYIKNGTGVQTQLNAKAPLTSPALTGAPTAPTPASTDNSTRIATTAFVRAATASNSGAIVGEIRLLPFRKANLPAGWYYPSGDYFALTSAVGKALAALPAEYKSDWGIVVSGQTIRLFDPEKFFAVDGAGATVGRFLRAVDGATRLPGSVQSDAIRNITGYHGWTGVAAANNYSGALFGDLTGMGYSWPSGPYLGLILHFDASRAIPTADENRPNEVGLTPAIYLGA